MSRVVVVSARRSAPKCSFSGTLPLIVLGAHVTTLDNTSLSNEPAECP